MTHCASLVVHSSSREDVYRDRVRVSAVHRGTIGEGVVCKLSVGGWSTLVEVRGIPDDDPLKNEGVIRMDDITRGNLGTLHRGQSYQFEMRPVRWATQFRWAWKASDPTARLAAQLGVIGMVLGILGAALGVIALLK